MTPNFRVPFPPPPQGLLIDSATDYPRAERILAAGQGGHPGPSLEMATSLRHLGADEYTLPLFGVL